MSLERASFFEKSISIIGRSMQNCFISLRLLSQGKIDSKELINHSVKIAYDTLPIISMTAIAVGVVIGIQLAPHFAARGVGNNIGIITALAMTRELAPMIGSMMLATQYGSGTAAELANMKVTEQVDALKVLKVDPIEYLVLPRFIAALIFSPIIIFLSAVLGIFSAYLTANFIEGISFGGYMRSIWDTLKISDVYICLIKASIFGVLIVLIATTMGLETRGGAKEVGRATTLTVVLSFVAIVIVDYIISFVYL